jgi:hypothetical protein
MYLIITQTQHTSYSEETAMSKQVVDPSIRPSLCVAVSRVRVDGVVAQLGEDGPVVDAPQGVLVEVPVPVLAQEVDQLPLQLRRGPCPRLEKVPVGGEHRLYLQPRQGVRLSASEPLEDPLELLGDEVPLLIIGARVACMDRSVDVGHMDVCAR